MTVKKIHFTFWAVMASAVMTSAAWAGLPSDVSRALDDYEAGQDSARRAMSIPAVEPVASRPVDMNERKRHETEMGFETYAYKYEETVEGGHFMDLKGRFYGIFIKHTFRPDPLNPFYSDLANMFRFEGRIAWAKLDYNGGVQDGSGNFVAPLTTSNVPDFVWEIRSLMGKEMSWGSLGVTPYAGFGMRFLHDDQSDTYGTFDYGGSTYSINGYKRTSEYYYLPMGVDLKQPLGPAWALGLNGEFDVFLYGHQKSFVDTTSGSVAKNVQNEGYGLRASLRLEKTANPIGFSLEPFVRYWDIENSDIADGGMEPSNTTREIGVKMGMIF